MKIATNASCAALALLLASTLPGAAGTGYSFDTFNRTSETVHVNLAMRNTVSLGSVNLNAGESYTLQVRGRPDLIEARSKHCHVSDPVPVPEAHVYRASVNVGADGHCSLFIYATGETVGGARRSPFRTNQLFFTVVLSTQEETRRPRLAGPAGAAPITNI